MFARRFASLISSTALLALPAALIIGCIGLGSPGNISETPPGDPSNKGYLFCFWNTENFFDDKLDNYHNHPDKEFDAWFANNPKVLKQKVDNLSRVLAELNDGMGPDILALAELESERSAELLMDALNAHIKNPELHYKHILMKEPKGFGRNIGTAIITRLPVIRDKTRLHGKRQRILEGHVDVNGHDLVILATHWTSRVTDEIGEGRDRYADQIYGVYRGMFMSNPKVDFLVCGDFNDPPDDESVVKHLHGIGDRERVRKSDRDQPLLYNLFLDKNNGKHGTHYYNGKWEIFDQILVSPDMLGDGHWMCDTESARIVDNLTADRKGRPKHFGNEHDKMELSERGYSDHFPVTVRLHVAG
jgi:endonuclease/exonuclease/phosphatase family metal-dependent hydrolase